MQFHALQVRLVFLHVLPVSLGPTQLQGPLSARPALPTPTAQPNPARARRVQAASGPRQGRRHAIIRRTTFLPW